MGRRYDEAAMAFTVARLVETFIGIACALLADIIFHPGARPREQLARCIAAALAAAAADDPSLQSQSLLIKSLHQQLALLMRHAVIFDT